MAAAWRAGASISEIAAQTGRHRATVTLALHSQGIAPAHRGQRGARERIEEQLEALRKEMEALRRDLGQQRANIDGGTIDAIKCLGCGAADGDYGGYCKKCFDGTMRKTTEEK
jgi:transposase-like protein